MISDLTDLIIATTGLLATVAALIKLFMPSSKKD